MGGAFGKDLDNVLTSVGVVSFGDTWSRRSNVKKRQREDVGRFAKEYRSDRLFTCVPGRYHRGLNNLKYNTNIRNPKKMGKKMRQLAQDMDKWDTFCGIQPVQD